MAQVGGFIFNLTVFAVGTLVAFLQSWQVALLTFCTVPLLTGIGMVYGRLCSRFLLNARVSTLKSCSIAGEVQLVAALENPLIEAKALKGFIAMNDKLRFSETFCCEKASFCHVLTKCISLKYRNLGIMDVVYCRTPIQQ